MPREMIVQKYGPSVFLDPDKARAISHRLNVEWKKDREECVVLYLDKHFENASRTLGHVEEQDRIGLTRREVNQLIAWLRRARNQEFGVDE